MAENEPWQDPRLPEDARLTSLEKRLKQAQLEEATRSGGRHAVADYYKSAGYRVLSVLIGYPLGCALIGFGFDYVAETRGAWVVMLFVGFVVAMWEVWKISKNSSHRS